MNKTCNQCKASLKAHWIKDGLCNGCKNPDSIVKAKTKQITIIGRRWFDRLNGNTYHSARIYVNNELIHTIGMTYGYGEQYEQNAIQWLKDNGHINKDLMRYEVREKYALVSECSDSLKRDLFKA
jgi:hypothetical protein